MKVELIMVAAIEDDVNLHYESGEFSVRDDGMSYCGSFTEGQAMMDAIGDMLQKLEDIE